MNVKILKMLFNVNKLKYYSNITYKYNVNRKNIKKISKILNNCILNKIIKILLQNT